jgi:vitamin B12/bleomycin/antimicrobial peptide transport system ATP-binding/permease protein
MLDRTRLPAEDRKSLLWRFWLSASGYWLDRTARQAWLLAALLVVLVLLQLLIQYRLNFWSRDFFNAISQRDNDLLWSEAERFLPLAAISLAVAVASVWGRMTIEREWRRWLSDHLYDYWLKDGHHLRLTFLLGDHQTPEYRIADDARVATEQPIDLVLGFLSSVLTAGAFMGVLYSIGGSLEVSPFGFDLTIPNYLVVAVLVYSISLTTATLFVGRRLTETIENNKAAEAYLRETGSRIRVGGEGASLPRSAGDGRKAIGAALDTVVARWRALCWQIMRMTVVSHTNVLVAPSVGALLCAPKYLAGAMTLGDMVQAAAAFVVVQGAFNWFADNYGRLAEWSSSASRVASLLVSLDQLEGASLSEEVPLLEPSSAQSLWLIQPKAEQTGLL